MDQPYDHLEPFGDFFHGWYTYSRTQWTRGQRHEPSWPARTLGSWVRIPLEAWMSMCVYSVCVRLCVGSDLRRADPPSKESYRLCIGLRNRKTDQGPKGCRATERGKEKTVYPGHSLLRKVSRHEVIGDRRSHEHIPKFINLSENGMKFVWFLRVVKHCFF
jgi:hypothetical protein